MKENQTASRDALVKPFAVIRKQLWEKFADGSRLSKLLNTVAPELNYKEVLQNGDASKGLEGWELLANGGDGWLVEHGPGAECRATPGDTNFATSFEWCRKSQLIDLLLLQARLTPEEVDRVPEINISDWMCARSDYESQYYLKAELRDANQQVLKTFETGEINAPLEPGGKHPFQKVEHTFRDYGENLRFIYFEHGGKNKQRMTGASVKVFLNSTSSRRSVDKLFPFTFDVVEFVEETPQFETVKVNAQGEVILREPGRASYFNETLGENILEMVAIPAGSFLMGSPDDEPKRSPTESPQHQVTVPAFFMGKYPVTQAQWRFVAGLPQRQRKLDPDPSWFKGDNLPVERVTWYDAVEFCDRLSVHTGREYRLPTEAEWEYACRAGTVTPFYFGKTITAALANYDGNYTYRQEAKGEYRNKTTPVGSFPPNAFGLYDMHGNVWEWCADHWHQDYNGAPEDGSAWLNESGDPDSKAEADLSTENVEELDQKDEKDFVKKNEDNITYVLRGGSWNYYPESCRSAFRYYNDPASAINSNDGFRVVSSASRT